MLNTRGRTLRALMASGFALVSSCSDGDGNEPGNATFTGELSGAYVESIDGEAYFGTARHGGELGFALVLGDGGPARIMLHRVGEGRPTAGTHEIVAPDDPAEPGTAFTGTVGYVTEGVLMQFEVRGGTVTIAESGGGAVAGTFELRAERISPCCDPAPVQVFVSGTFDAAPYDS